MPTYNANIPQATDQMSQSQDQILQNFQVLGNFVNGVIDIPVSASAPTFPSGDVGLYNLSYSYPSVPTNINELYITNSSGISTPLTASQKSPNGWCYLPSGLLMAWGQFTASVGTGTFTYATISNFPGFTNTPLMFQLTPARTIASPNFQVYLDSFTGGANTNTQLGVYITGTTSAVIRFLVMGT